MKVPHFLLCCALLAAGSTYLRAQTPQEPLAPSPSAVDARSPTDLDAFMARVLQRRDENWKKLQQYILEEEERLQVTGADGNRVYGFDRDYLWFMRDAFFMRSPLAVDGVSIGEGERAKYEAEWLRREQRREKRAAERAAERDSAQPSLSIGGDEAFSASLEPRFVSAAYFLRFEFDPGQYAFVGREQFLNRDVLLIEYYPTNLFREGRARPDRRVRERDQDIERKMNKTAVVTLRIDPREHQILHYALDNLGMDFLPGRSLVRVEEAKATMEMSQPFPEVWLPADIRMQFALATALGPVSASYHVRYHSHRLASVATKIRPPQ